MYCNLVQTLSKTNLSFKLITHFRGSLSCVTVQTYILQLRKNKTVMTTYHGITYTLAIIPKLFDTHKTTLSAGEHENLH